MIKEQIIKMEELGWSLDLHLSDEHELFFKRKGEELTIDLDKLKISLINYNDDELNQLSYETLKIIMEVLKEYE